MDLLAGLSVFSFLFGRVTTAVAENVDASVAGFCEHHDSLWISRSVFIISNHPTS